jgi:predicted unusual protein kinase regulating ubiquinone biosynthesis (AarF/ABC1/UbiB family)
MADSEENSIGGRLKRYARVGAAVGGLGVRFGAGRLFGVELDKTKHAGELRAALGGLKGPLMKVAQLMSTIPDALPDEYVKELIQLQSNAPSMGWPFVKRRMAAELGPDWETKFKQFEREAIAAASLGQVHRATGKDGALLACKLQYPNMDSAVEADLRQLRLIFAVYERYDKAVKTREVHAEITARLREELDYDREARHMRLYGHMLREEANVSVPELVPALSTRRLLTMTWLDGVKLLTLKKAPVARRNAVATAMFRAWYVPFYYYGVIHGDPHLGNYSVRDDDGVNLMDFGCIRVFPPKFVGGVIDLYHALDKGDQALAVHAYETWGFKGLSKEMIAVLNQWAAFVYAPLMEDRPRLIQETNSGVYGREVAQKVHGDIRRLGGVTPPREFVLMDRAAIGLGSVFLHLDAKINWHRLFHDLIKGFDLKALARRQAAALKKADVPAAH